MSRRYHQSLGYLDRQPSWDVVEVEPPQQVYYDPPRPSSPTGLLQYEGRSPTFRQSSSFLATTVSR